MNSISIFQEKYRLNIIKDVDAEYECIKHLEYYNILITLFPKGVVKIILSYDLNPLMSLLYISSYHKNIDGITCNFTLDYSFMRDNLIYTRIPRYCDYVYAISVKINTDNRVKLSMNNLNNYTIEKNTMIHFRLIPLQYKLNDMYIITDFPVEIQVYGLFIHNREEIARKLIYNNNCNFDDSIYHRKNEKCNCNFCL